MKGSARTFRGFASRRSTRIWLIAGAIVALAVAVPVASTAVSQVVDDIQVNNSAADTGDNTTQSETSLAVNGSTICAGFNDSGDPAPSFSGFARSANLGQSWTDQGELGATSGGDPAIAVNNTTGTFYYAENATLGGNAAIGVARSTDNCTTFGAAVDASPNSTGNTTVGDRTTFLDKPWIAVDNTGGANQGNVYVCFTRFVDTTNPSDGNADTGELRFSRSTDGGATYVNEQVLAPQGDRAWGCSVHVGPNGEVHVTWAEGEGPWVGMIPTAGDLHHRASTDGGQTFGVLNTIAVAQRIAGSDRQVTCDGQIRRTLNGDIRMLHEAWNATDATGGPFSGNVYVVWARDPAGTVDNSDVLFSRSTDGGTTWSAPIQLGATTATDQFEPFVAVGGRGVVSVAWYDRINDAANNFNIDVYKAFSTDGGVTFGAVQRVTNQSFGVPQLNPNFDNRVRNCYMGEYIGVAADANNFYYLWGDNRNTVTNTTWPTGRPDPDVFFESEAVPAGAPATLTLAPKTASNPVDAQHCVTATVQDIFGAPTPGITVRFTVTGSVNTTGAQTTNASGQATFCYTGPPLPGADAISAYADTDNDNVQDAGEPSDTAAKTWVLPSGTALCVVKVTNGGWIITDAGDRANFGGNAKESSSLVASGNENYQDHGPAEPMHVKSIIIQAITCNPAQTQASIFGQATINGTGNHNFRIDVQDNGEPGKGADHYRMRLDTGYDSGDHILSGGNVQIH
jgi:hypothetical protein